MTILPEIPEDGGTATSEASGTGPGTEAGTDRVRVDAARRGVSIEIVPRPNAGSLAEAAELLGVSQDAIIKSLVVKRHDGSFLFALVPGGRQISWPKLRAVVGVNRLTLPSPELALEVTGYERGTITPFGSSTAWPVFIDERAAGTRIALGAGSRGWSAWVLADELIAAFDATVADITTADTVAEKKN